VEARRTGTSYFAEGRRRRGYKRENLGGETSRTQRARIWRYPCSVHSDGLVDGKGGGVIVDPEVIEMKDMGSRRIADENRIKAIPGKASQSHTRLERRRILRCFLHARHFAKRGRLVVEHYLEDIRLQEPKQKVL
jgi:hypothetical protein